MWTRRLEKFCSEILKSKNHVIGERDNNESTYSEQIVGYGTLFHVPTWPIPATAVASPPDIHPHSGLHRIRSFYELLSKIINLFFLRSKHRHKI